MAILDLACLFTIKGLSLNSCFTAVVRALHFLLPTLNELEILVEMVLTSLKQLDLNKATGSDGIPVRLLKETA